MKFSRILLPVLTGGLAAACQSSPAVTWVSTTYETPWQVHPAESVSREAAEATIVLDLSRTAQTIEGFGSCFNEQGWASLSHLTEAERESIFHELYAPGAGANFTMGRMPIGSNDFSLGYYSYDDVDGDFGLEHFSVAHDEETLIPFIHAAQAVYPGLRIWASPWCPPSWMKVNKHYANSSTLPIVRRFAEIMKQLQERPDDVRATGGSSFGMDPSKLADNGLPESRQVREGEDAFNLDPKYLEAYARYFGKFVEAYKGYGIDIYMVMPQNEPNSAQWYPACTWTPDGLKKFIRLLGPEMEKHGVEVYLGTIERADVTLWDQIVNDPEAGPYIKGLGFQWAGRDALPGLHKEFPDLPCYMTEQECGNGQNDWKGAMHAWELMKHYFSNGVEAYFYWNTSLFEGEASVWGWNQNSLVTVNRADRTYRYTPEYYVLKHASHYVQPGAKLLNFSGTYDNALAFVNPDGSVAVLAANETDGEQPVTLTLKGRSCTVTLPARSLNTVVL